MSNNVKKNKYTNLVSNTILFAVAGFGPKVLSFILLPIVTGNLAATESSTAVNIIAACNFILPIMYLCINEAVIRFGAEKTVPKTDVYTTGILTVISGFAVVLFLYPWLSRLSFFSGYVYLVYLYVLASSMRTTTNHYVRSQGHVKLFAIDGIMTSVMTLLCTVLFLVVFDMGVKGYLLATIVPDAISAISLTIITKSYNDFSITGLNKDVSRQMLRYSLPLVPAAISWSITNMSDKFVITHYLGPEVNGLYAYADRIPSLILIVSAIFIQAWQLSAFSETSAEEGEAFFSRVFKSYSALIFIAGSGLLLLLRPLTKLVLADSYYITWRYSPFLILSVVFSCLVTFLGTIYNFNKENLMVTVTTIGSGVVDLVLNIIMIPIWGVQGGTISTFISYLLVFIIRAVDTRRYMKIDIQPFRIGASTLLMILQIWICLSEPAYGVLMQVGVLAAIVIVNIKELKFVFELVFELVNGIIKKRKAD